jgi:hypothetical protein
MRWQPLRRLCLAALAGPALVVATAAPADAQAPEQAAGAADFRTAPLVGEGTYRDDVVVGETVWYSVLYTNDEPLSVSARLVDVDVEADDTLELERLLVGPTLDEVYADDSDFDGTARSGAGDTNIWFVAFRLNSTGRQGVRHELEFELDGVGATDREQCGPGCPLEAELAELQDEIGDLEARAEPVATRDELREAVDEARTAVIELCGGEECDGPASSSSTPWAQVALLGAVALVTVGGLARALRQRRAAP